MPNSEQSEIGQLQTDVALLRQFNESVTQPALMELKKTQAEIKNALESLAFLSIADFEAYKKEVSAKFKELKRRTWVQNTLSALAGAVLTVVVIRIVTDWLNGK